MRALTPVLLCVATLLAGMVLPVAAVGVSDRVFLLVAHPRMQDENFSGTVVLVIDEAPGGPLGVILNRPSEFSLSQVFSGRAEFSGRDDLLFFGGPVQPEALLFAFRAGTPPEKGLHVADDIYISGFSNTLNELLKRPQDVRDQRFFSGYAGWTKGQLEAEIAQGGWYVMGFDPTAVFEVNPLGMYQEMLKRASAPRIETLRDLPVAQSLRH